MKKKMSKKTLGIQKERQDQTIKMMDEGGYWEVDSPPFALDPHLRNELKRRWEDSRKKMEK